MKIQQNPVTSEIWKKGNPKHFWVALKILRCPAGLDRVERLREVADDVVDVFHADAEPDRGRGDVLVRKFLRAHL